MSKPVLDLKPIKPSRHGPIHRESQGVEAVDITSDEIREAVSEVVSEQGEQAPHTSPQPQTSTDKPLKIPNNNLPPSNCPTNQQIEKPGEDISSENSPLTSRYHQPSNHQRNQAKNEPPLFKPSSQTRNNSPSSINYLPNPHSLTSLQQNRLQNPRNLDPLQTKSTSPSSCKSLPNPHLLTSPHQNRPQAPLRTQNITSSKLNRPQTPLLNGTPQSPPKYPGCLVISPPTHSSSILAIAQLLPI